MKLTISITLLLLTFNSIAQEKTCADFKTGKFTYSDPDYADLITIRNDSIQTDAYPSMGWEITSRIKWLDNCTYETECIKVNNHVMASLIGTTYVIEIIEINDNKILCKTETDGIVVEKEMIKIESD
ncbi:MAG: hypothetical protein ACWA5P_07740 [bacterium]